MTVAPLGFHLLSCLLESPQAYKRRPLVSFPEELHHYNNHIQTRLHKKLHTPSTSKVIEDPWGPHPKVVYLFLQWLQPITSLFIKYRTYTMWWSVFFKNLRFKPIKDSKHHVASTTLNMSLQSSWCIFTFLCICVEREKENHKSYLFRQDM